MRKYTMIFFLFFFSIIFPKDNFKIGYSDFKPFIWKENGNAKGIFVEVINSIILEYLEIPVTFEYFPIKRVQYKVESGELDAFIDMSNQNYLEFSVTGEIPVAVGFLGLYTYKNNPDLGIFKKFRNLKELEKYKIISYLGDSMWEKLEGYNVDYGAVDLKSSLGKLKYKRGDMLMGTEQVVNFNNNEYNFQKDIIQVPGVLFNPSFYQLHISEKSKYKNIINDFDRILKEMINKGKINDIYEKYHANSEIGRYNPENPQISLIFYWEDATAERVKAISERFNSKYNENLLKVIPFDMEQYKQAVKIMLSGGLPSEILMTWAGYRLQYLIDSGNLSDIENVWKKEIIQDRYDDLMQEKMTYNNKKYALPITQHYFLFFYNKEIFKRFGIEKPKSWEEFIKIGELLKSKEITPIALGSKERWPAANWFDYLLVRTAGYEFRQKLMLGKVPYDSDEVKRVYEIWKDLIDKDFFNSHTNFYNYKDALKLVHDGQAAMTLMGTWSMGYLENNFGWKAVDDYDVFAFPVIDSNIPNVGVSVVDVMVKSKRTKSDTVEKVMEFFTNKENQIFLNEKTGALSPNNNILISEYSEIKQRIKKEVGDNKFEIFSYDLSTPPIIAELGLSSFSEFLENPNRYIEILSDLENAVQEGFR